MVMHKRNINQGSEPNVKKSRSGIYQKNQEIGNFYTF